MCDGVRHQAVYKAVTRARGLRYAGALCAPGHPIIDAKRAPMLTGIFPHMKNPKNP